MGRRMVGLVASQLIISGSGAGDFLRLDPCRLMCHLEHSLDHCKLVSTAPDTCSNFFWLNSTRDATVIDRSPEGEYVTISTKEAVDILRVGKGGCEAICESHPECVDSGSECKLSGVCLNLFWTPGSPSRDKMTTCYQRALDGCNDGTPILCGHDPVPRRHDALVPQHHSSDEGSGIAEAQDSSSDSYEPVAGSSSDTQSLTSIYWAPSLLVIPFFTRF